ncbi:hypothetical protein [Thalassotalea litorea]|uniref:hypothetical protein n=1 Tax=Thalassotalea litorea TaxID=2020715 RepID=UPI0037354550
MPKLNDKLHVISELTDVDNELTPLKEMADRECTATYGLTGMVYRPHLDAYMQGCIKKAEILACLKRQSILPLSEVELISSTLDSMHKGARNHAIVEYKGDHYQRIFLPLKLSKSGKTVQKWAKIWLLQQDDGKVDLQWKCQVKEIWPTYFLIRISDL